MMKRKIAIWSMGAACALFTFTGTAVAHGNESHAGNASVVKEQKDWGIAGEAARSTRTITLRMTDDMRFTPDRFSVKKGETVTLRVENKGRIMHEVVLGTPATLQQHADMMLKFPGMEHSEPYMAHVAPDKAEDLVWNFNRAGQFEFACLIAGHFQAGMRGILTVME